MTEGKKEEKKSKERAEKHSNIRNRPDVDAQPVLQNTKPWTKSLQKLEHALP
jgi:hypothetical protein